MLIRKFNLNLIFKYLLKFMEFFEDLACVGILIVTPYCR